MWRHLFCSLQLMWLAWPFKEWYLNSTGRRSGNLKSFLKSTTEIPISSQTLCTWLKYQTCVSGWRQDWVKPQVSSLSKFWHFKNLLGSCSGQIFQTLGNVDTLLASPGSSDWDTGSSQSPWLIWRPRSDCSQLICPAALFPILVSFWGTTQSNEKPVQL